MIIRKRALHLLIAVMMLFVLFGCKKNEAAPEQMMVPDPVELTVSFSEATVTVPAEETIEATLETIEPMTEPVVENVIAETTVKPETESKSEATNKTVYLSVANKTPYPHSHQWVNTVTSPTCISMGYTTCVCKICGKTETNTYTNATGHSFDEWKTKQAASETSEGKAERSCLVCSKVENRIIQKLPVSHVHSYTDTVTVAPTCSTAGVKAFTCNCGNQYTESIAKRNHSYTSKTVPATCTAKGYTLYTCSVCSNSYKDNYTSVSDHDYRTKVTVPTCTERGYTTYTCKNCPESHIGEYVSSTEHSWGSWKVVREATITSTGMKERYCNNCGTKKTDTIEKIPHTHKYTDKATKEATCDSAGVRTFTCACGDSYTEVIPSSGHNWSDWKTTKEATESSVGSKERACSVCKKIETKVISKIEHTHSLTHIVTKPTCTADGYTMHKCSTCSYSYIDSNVSSGHSWCEWNTVTEPTQNSTGIALRICSSCSTSETKVLDKLPVSHIHSYTVVELKNATCSSDGYHKKVCSCGDMITENVDASHNWQHHHENEVGHWVVYIVCHCGWRCSADGDYITAFANHVNSVDPATRYDHSYYDTGEWVVDIPAKDWYACTDCGAIK